MTLALKMADARYDGFEEGISIGLERGAYQKALETARNILTEGLAPQMVSCCIGLSLETVLELAAAGRPSAG